MAVKAAEAQKKAKDDLDIRCGTVEGVILVNEKPQIEPADMPLTLSFGSIEELERFCRAVKHKGLEQC